MVSYEQALGRVHARVETPAVPERFIIAGEIKHLREQAVRA